GRSLFVLLHPDATPVELDGVGAEPLRHGVQQAVLQVPAMDRELRPPVSRFQAGRFPEYELSEAVEEDRFARGHRDLGQGFLHAEFVEYAHRMRQQVHAGAKRLYFGHGFINAAGYARVMKRKGKRQAADSGADDEDFTFFGHMLLVGFMSMDVLDSW